MTIIYNDISALKFYRAFELRSRESLSARECNTVLSIAGSTCAPSKLDSLDHWSYVTHADDGKVHVLVPGKSCFRKSESYSYRTWDSELPKDSLIRIGEGVYVVSPEFLFLQMARYLSWLQLTLLGMELCGCYKVGETRRNRKGPVTTPGKLSRFIDSCPRKSGTRRARRALRYVVARAFSPMESKVTLLLCLPRALGGYGYSFPDLNREIPVPPELCAACGCPELKCDLYWEDFHFAIEYDSDEHHSEASEILSDSRRNATLAAMGIDVMTLRKQDVYFVDAFEAAAAKIGYALGRHDRPTTEHMRKARIELRRELLCG